jgi:hypothetical protein
MKAIEISRATVAEVEEKQQSLGYGRFLNCLSFMRSAKRVAALTPLQQVLRECDVDILNRQDVHRYQVEKAAERAIELLSQWTDRMLRRGEFPAYERFHGPAWKVIEYRKFRRPVPEFVTRKAHQILAKMPQAWALVEYLEDHPDPFLVIATGEDEGDERYYVEVWGEPEFERQLEDKP